MAEFVSCFYALWYLQADEVVKAPYLDLIAIQQMYKYRGVTENKEAVNKVIGNLMKHNWYLDSTMVPLALLDEEVPASEKRKIANALLSLNMPHTDRFGYKTEEKEVMDVKDVLTPELFAEELPSMSSLVNTFSFYMFSLLGFEEERLRGWLVLPPEAWQTQSYTRDLKNLLKPWW